MEKQPVPVHRREMVALVGATALAGCSGLGTPNRQAITLGDHGQQNDVEEDDVQGTRQGETVRAFVGSYHWGYFLLDEDGEELDRLTLSSGDELRLTLFSVEADAAVEDLPQAVRTNVPSSDERARRNEQAIPVPRGTTLDALHDAAEAAYPDHSLAILDDELLENGPDGGGPGQGPDGGGPGQGPDGGGPGQGPWGGHHGPHGEPSGPGNGRGRGQGPGGPDGHGPGMPGACWGGTCGGTLAPPVYLWHHSTVPTELGFVVNTTGTFGFVCTVYCGYGHPYMVERGRIEVNE